jgi:tRNA pseudouridine65 synthase
MATNYTNQTLQILYQDEHFVAINKPSGLLVHKSLIDKKETLYAMKILRNQLKQWVYPLHRLDKPTSGVLLFALSSYDARLLSEAFVAKKVQKHYIGVVRGYCDSKGFIDHPLVEKLDKTTDAKAQKNKPAQPAQTSYKRIATIELDFAVGKYKTTRYSLVELTPHTGRKHQLRRHCKHISHHLLGDTKYGRGEHNKFIRQHFGVHRLLLHAYKLQFTHPYTKENITIHAPLDTTFTALLEHFQWQEAYKNLLLI